jgi:exosortase J
MNSISQSGVTPSFTPDVEKEPHSAFPAGLIQSKPFKLSPFAWSCLAVTVLFAAFGLMPLFISLWDTWTTDPLRSIGMLIVPAAVLLILREWRLSGWEVRGTWWGLVPLLLAYLDVLRPHFLLVISQSAVSGVNVLPQTLPLYLLGCGVILLFAGPGVWQRAWFPLALLLLAQPVPGAFVRFLDYPLQSFAARTARVFATSIGFAPTNPEVLKLMFTPTFGMFIAPGCDGLRGAVGLGYAGLFAGYLKRVSLGRWILYVTGGILLGHLFNLIRLCALVLYYRIAVGHPSLENLAREADYFIGGVLFLVAVTLFLTVVFRHDVHAHMNAETPGTDMTPTAGPTRSLIPKIACVFFLATIALIPAVSAMRTARHSILASLHSGQISSQDLDNMLPKQLGNFKLVRTWQEESSGAVVMESASYKSSSPDEVTVGIWLAHGRHNAHDSWMIRGESPEMRSFRSYVTSEGRVVSFDTAFYSDGITDRFTGTVNCTLSFCRTDATSRDFQHFQLVLAQDPYFTSDGRAVPFFFSVERPHRGAETGTVVKELSIEAQNFLAVLDLGELSKRFQ